MPSCNVLVSNASLFYGVDELSRDMNQRFRDGWPSSGSPQPRRVGDLEEVGALNMFGRVLLNARDQHFVIDGRVHSGCPARR